MDEWKEKAWVKRKRPYLFIEAIKTFAPPYLPDGTCSFPTRRDWRYGWATRTRIDESPVIRGRDICFDKMCPENSLAICAVAG